MSLSNKSWRCLRSRIAATPLTAVGWFSFLLVYSHFPVECFVRRIEFPRWWKWSMNLTNVFRRICIALRCSVVVCTQGEHNAQIWCWQKVRYCTKWRTNTFWRRAIYRIPHWKVQCHISVVVAAPFPTNNDSLYLSSYFARGPYFQRQQCDAMRTTSTCASMCTFRTKGKRKMFTISWKSMTTWLSWVNSTIILW